MTEPESPVRIIGSYVSPYVRKVLAVLALKGIRYEIDPIPPFFGNDKFSELSPLRRIPVLIDDEVSLCDSSVICQYLEDRHPGNPVYPDAIAKRAEARWLEEYADSRMGDIFIWKLFREIIINPGLFGKPKRVEFIASVLADEVPPIFDYLEARTPAAGFLFGDKMSIADVSVAAILRNAELVRVTPAADRWPNLSAWYQRTQNTPAFAGLRPLEELCLKTPPHQQRAALDALDAPLSPDTFFDPTPHKSIMLGD